MRRNEWEIVQFGTLKLVYGLLFTYKFIWDFLCRLAAQEYNILPYKRERDREYQLSHMLTSFYLSLPLSVCVADAAIVVVIRSWVWVEIGNVRMSWFLSAHRIKLKFNIEISNRIPLTHTLSHTIAPLHSAPSERFTLYFIWQIADTDTDTHPNEQETHTCSLARSHKCTWKQQMFHFKHRSD